MAKLNAESASPAIVRVRQLLERLIQAETLRLEIFKQDPTGADPSLQAKNQEFQAALKDIREMLSRYRWTPELWQELFFRLMVVYRGQAKSEDEEWENRSVS